eukprot:m51a1_g8547 hypothetical protein (1362) ;mRNA; f:73621-78939
MARTDARVFVVALVVAAGATGAAATLKCCVYPCQVPISGGVFLATQDAPSGLTNATIHFHEQTVLGPGMRDWDVWTPGNAVFVPATATATAAPAPHACDAGATSPVGDVDGDGQGDVAVGGVAELTVVLGPLWGASSPPVASVQGAVDGGTAFRVAVDGPGCAGAVVDVVAAAGDVDGDGVDDVAALCAGVLYVVAGRRRGTQPWPTSTSYAALVAAPSSSSSSSGSSTGVRALVGGATRAAGVGDVDGDGCSDLCVALGSGSGSGSGSGEGVVVVVPGRPAALWPRVVDLREPAEHKGAVVVGAATFAGAWDVDGDGRADVVLGNPAASPRGVAGAGAAWGVLALEGSARGQGVGCAVAGAGDVDGDGADDVVVGELPGESARHFVVFCSASAPSAWPRALSLAPGAAHPAVHVSALSANRVAAPPGDSGAGASVASSAGDVDGDGVGDLVLCRAVPRVSHVCTVVLGGPEWPAAAAVGLGGDEGDDALLANRTAVLEGPAPCGTALAAAPLGDVDGDGLGDLLLGVPDACAPGEQPRSAVRGAAVAVRGRRDFALEPRVRLEAIARLPQRAHVLTGGPAPPPPAQLSGVGDVDGDGSADWALGAAGVGRVYVHLGPSLPRDAAPALPAAPPAPPGAAAVVLTTAGGSADLLGWSVSRAGDVDGDGAPDVVVGAPGAAGGAGRAYVVFGRRLPWAPGAAVDLDAAADGLRAAALAGDAAVGGCGRAVGAAGDVNGDGVDDLLVAAAHAPGPLALVDRARAYVVFGRRTWDGTLALASLDGARGFAVDVDAGRPLRSFVAVPAGDLNGDALADVAVATSPAARTAAAAWSAHVLFGRNATWAPSLTVAALDGASGFAVAAPPGRPDAPLVLAAAGDTDGDRCDDLLVGSGLLLGRRGPWPPVVDAPDAAMPSAFDSAAGPAASADFNGDALPDVLFVRQPSDGGASVLRCVLGRANRSSSSLWAAGPYEGGRDGFDVFWGGGPDPTAARGLVAVAAAGDLDGDGTGDVLVGAAGGGVWVLHGSREPRVAAEVGRMGGCCSALSGTPFEFAVPRSAFEQPGGGQLAASAVVAPEARWLRFDNATWTFSGMPEYSPDSPRVLVALTATNGAGASATQRFAVDVVCSLDLDVGADAHAAWGAVAWLSPIAVSSQAQRVAVAVEAQGIFKSHVWLLSEESGGGAVVVAVEEAGGSWRAEGPVEGVNRLLARLAVSAGYRKSVDLLVTASTDGAGCRRTKAVRIEWEWKQPQPQWPSGSNRVGNNEEGLSTDTIAVIICSVLLGLSAVGCLGLCIRRRRTESESVQQHNNQHQQQQHNNQQQQQNIQQQQQQAADLIPAVLELAVEMGELHEVSSPEMLPSYTTEV